MGFVCVCNAGAKERGRNSLPTRESQDSTVCDEPHKRNSDRNRHYTTTVLLQSASSSVSVVTRSASRLLVDSGWLW